MFITLDMSAPIVFSASQGPRPPRRRRTNVKRPGQPSVRQQAVHASSNFDKTYRTTEAAPAAGGASHKIITGPHGGRYYLKNSKKVYI